MTTRYLTHLAQCPITIRQGEMLLDHMRHGERRIYRTRDRLTARTLQERGWITYNPVTGGTALTESGRRAAEQARKALARRPGPSIVPDIEESQAAVSEEIF